MKKSLLSLVILLSGSSLKSEATVECGDITPDCMNTSVTSCHDMTTSNSCCPEQLTTAKCDIVCEMPNEVAACEKQATVMSFDTPTMDTNDMASMQLCMMQAVTNNDVDMVQKMVEAGVNINCCDENGKTPLMCAVDMGHLEMYQYLMQKGADAHMRDHSGNSVLSYACSKTRSTDMEIDHKKLYQHQEIILNLLEMGVDF
jgi:hypothetical protein